MKEMKVGNNLYRETLMDIVFNVPGGPTLKIKNVKSMRCFESGDYYIDALTLQKRDQAILAWMIKYYTPHLQIPGKAAEWIRKLIHLPLNEWAELSCGLSQSTFSQAAKRNSMIDRYAGFVLLKLAGDYLTGSKSGRILIENTKKSEGESFSSEFELEVA
jgi:hypothetical protein